MRAIVINLDSEKERMAFQQEQLQRLGLPFTRLTAVSLETLSADDYRQHVNGWQRPLRKVELACFLSHLNAWRLVIETGQPHLILEDDALLSCHIQEALEHLESSDCEYATLETRQRTKFLSKKTTRISEHFHTAFLIQDKCGAAGYVLSPTGAKKLVDLFEAKAGASVPDAFIAHYYGWKAIQVIPPAVIQLDCCKHYQIYQPLQTKTTINNKPKPKAESWLVYLKVRSRRFFAQLQIASRVLRHIGMGRYIELLPDADHFPNDELSTIQD